MTRDYENFWNLGVRYLNCNQRINSMSIKKYTRKSEFFVTIKVQKVTTKVTLYVSG